MGWGEISPALEIKMKFIAILLLMMLCGCVSDWTYKDTFRQIAISSLIIIDRNQTIRMQKDGRYYEANRLLGNYPSDSRINNYMAGCLLSNFIISSSLDSDSRALWQTTTLFFDYSFVSGNYRRSKKYGKLKQGENEHWQDWHWDGYNWIPYYR